MQKKPEHLKFGDPKFSKVLGTVAKKSEKKSLCLSLDLNPGPHDLKESVLTTRPSWNVIKLGEK